ncbi:MAG: hypothetical protein ACR2QW_19710, partial [bacterium]
MNDKTLHAIRTIEAPIIVPEMDDRIGTNINGPSLIYAPGWLPNRLGNYYLYFAHHKGTYIRLAYADEITGPWSIYSPGVLDVKDSLFETEDVQSNAAENQTAWSSQFNNKFLYAHVASPHVIADQSSRELRMYYHGLLKNGDQQTRLAVSTDGLSFKPLDSLLGPPYFRVFEFAPFIYAISWGGDLWRAVKPQGPFEHGPRVIPDPPLPNSCHGFRHGEVYLSDNRLVVFYSRIGDCPEHIVYSTVELQANWNFWKASEPITLLKPERTWEGADLTLIPSSTGTAENKENGLRDPCVFTDIDG